MGRPIQGPGIWLLAQAEVLADWSFWLRTEVATGWFGSQISTVGSRLRPQGGAAADSRIRSQGGSAADSWLRPQSGAPPIPGSESKARPSGPVAGAKLAAAGGSSSSVPLHKGPALPGVTPMSAGHATPAVETEFDKAPTTRPRNARLRFVQWRPRPRRFRRSRSRQRPMRASATTNSTRRRRPRPRAGLCRPSWPRHATAMTRKVCQSALRVPCSPMWLFCRPNHGGRPTPNRLVKAGGFDSPVSTSQVRRRGQRRGGAWSS